MGSPPASRPHASASVQVVTRPLSRDACVFGGWRVTGVELSQGGHLVSGRLSDASGKYSETIFLIVLCWSSRNVFAIEQLLYAGLMLYGRFTY